MTRGKFTLWGDKAQRRTHDRPSEVEHVPTVDRCPRCDAAVTESTMREPALFFHGGHGATRRTVTRSCPDCAWSSVVDVTEERP